jgi:hemolysin-activating ACP:hemolysin acyltransferase
LEAGILHVAAETDLENPGTPGDVEPPPLGFVRPRDPRIGFAESVAHLMGKPAFARAPFGHIARILAGQVGRGHYALVRRGTRIVGFVGWARAGEAPAEAWLAGVRGLSDAEARAGDCVVINAWQADEPAVSRFILKELSAALGGCRRVYAKRHYPDGRVRPLRLDVARRSGAARGPSTPNPMEAPAP